MSVSEQKRALRYKRTLRRYLVHAAGCTESHCLSKLEIADDVYRARCLGVRIPRSFAGKEKRP